MTRRQLHALNALVQATASDPSSGMHYAALAQKLGVSKWSAYDMLLTLEKAGLVHRDYELPPGGRAGGRPRVLFRPTSKGLYALGERLNSVSEAAEPGGLHEHIFLHLQDTTPKESKGSAQEWTESESAVGRCAHLIASLLAVAQDSLQRVRLRRDLRRILQSPLPASTKLSTFCGTIVASLGRLRPGEHRFQAIRDLLAKLEIQIAQLHPSERFVLLVFVSTALKRFGPFAS
ncbi:MAG: hypothetical protein ACUVX8_08585 [Candidatus Zipacnadales bacterium]